jgi:hypothetical protein
MGGNREQITVTCAVLGRLIGLAGLAEAMADDARDAANKEQIAQYIKHETAYLDGEIRWMHEIQKACQ